VERPKLEVADIFRRYGEAYRQQHDGSLSTAQRRVMTAIEVCRTAALGGHLERCDRCGYERPAYDSCGNRHCPKCQSLARAEWVEKRTAEVLDSLLVGSRSGAVSRRSGLSVAPRFLWEGLTSRTVNRFPDPAASNVVCGFPALRSPVWLPVKFYTSSGTKAAFASANRCSLYSWYRPSTR
jgi:hypothetical protein